MARPAAPSIPTLLIRADATAAIGLGHVMRCLALCQAWIDRGGQAVLVSAGLPEAIAKRVAQDGVRLCPIAEASGSPADAAATLAIAEHWQADWIMVDGYQFHTPYHLALKAGGRRLALMDDQGALDLYVADLVVNQNLHADTLRYDRCLPTTRLLLGPRFALLRREFRLWQGPPRQFPAQAHKLLVLLGGSDPADQTSRVVEQLLPLSLDLTVVVGPANPRLEQIRARFADHACILANVRDLTPLIVAADMALSSSGSTVWEMARFALPMILGAAVPVEDMVARRLAEAGAGRYLGPFADVPGLMISQAVRSLSNDPAGRQHLGQQAQALIDGQGAERVTQVLRDAIAGAEIP